MKKMIALSVIFLMILISEYGAYGAAYLFSDDFRKLVTESRDRESLFIRRIKDKISIGKSEIYLREITEFNWDIACYVYEYSNVKRTLESADIKIENPLTALAIPSLNEGEEGFVFLHKNYISGFVKGGRAQDSFEILYPIATCAKRDTARILAVPANRELRPVQARKFRKTHDISDLDSLGRCEAGETECRFIYTGG